MKRVQVYWWKLPPPFSLRIRQQSGRNHSGYPLGSPVHQGIPLLLHDVQVAHAPDVDRVAHGHGARCPHQVGEGPCCWRWRVVVIAMM